jgi:hypothetical protein
VQHGTHYRPLKEVIEGQTDKGFSLALHLHHYPTEASDASF